MYSVFVAGSRAVSKLNAQVKTRLDNIVKENFRVLVGDASGADKAVQRYLAERRYQHVVVYCMDVCRNNIGNWPTQKHTAETRMRLDRQYFGIKDLSMARDASCGFMIWDGISKGTLTNVVNLLKTHKKVLLYSAPKKDFFTVRTREDLNYALTSSGIKDVDGFLRSLVNTQSESDLLRFAFHS